MVIVDEPVVSVRARGRLGVSHHRRALCGFRTHDRPAVAARRGGAGGRRRGGADPGSVGAAWECTGPPDILGGLAGFRHRLAPDGGRSAYRDVWTTFGLGRRVLPQPRATSGDRIDDR